MDEWISDEMNRQFLNIYRVDDIVLAMGITKKIAESTGFSEHDSVLLQLVTEEACMNAFEYGFPLGICDFKIAWLVESGIMEITVGQNGEAFELHHDLASQMKCLSRGRGLVLIQGIMDEVKLIPTESYVTLLMRRGRRD
jgi:serine/threonine-protein kinase RsbW